MLANTDARVLSVDWQLDNHFRDQARVESANRPAGICAQFLELASNERDQVIVLPRTTLVSTSPDTSGDGAAENVDRRDGRIVDRERRTPSALTGSFSTAADSANAGARNAIAAPV